MSDPVTVTVTLRPVRPDTDISRAVRWALKRWLRTWGLRCVRVTWGTADDSSPLSVEAHAAREEGQSGG